MVIKWIVLLACVGAHALCGGLSVKQRPICMIEGARSCLKAPVGVVFSPSGDCLAVADPQEGGVFIFPRNAAGNYNRVPSCLLKAQGWAPHPESVAFSEDGCFLFVSGPTADNVVIYHRKDTGSCNFALHPYWILDGEAAALQAPARLRCLPGGNMLAVINTQPDETLTLYKMWCRECAAPEIFPFQTLDWRQFGIELPFREFALTPDGSQLILASCGSDNAEVSLLQVHTDIFGKVFFDILESQYYSSTTLRSLDVHPSGRYFAVVHEKIVFFEIEGETFSFSCEHQFHDGIVKRAPVAVAFSPVGNRLAVLTDVPEILILDIDECD